MKELKQLNFRASKELIERAEKCIDGIRIRTIGHILNVALFEWLSLHENQPDLKIEDPYSGERRQIVVRLPAGLIDGLDSYVHRRGVRSRNFLIHVAIKEFMRRNNYK